LPPAAERKKATPVPPGPQQGRKDQEGDSLKKIDIHKGRNEEECKKRLRTLRFSEKEEEREDQLRKKKGGSVVD